MWPHTTTKDTDESTCKWNSSQIHKLNQQGIWKGKNIMFIACTHTQNLDTKFVTNFTELSPMWAHASFIQSEQISLLKNLIFVRAISNRRMIMHYSDILKI